MPVMMRGPIVCPLCVGTYGTPVMRGGGGGGGGDKLRNKQRPLKSISRVFFCALGNP